LRFNYDASVLTYVSSTSAYSGLFDLWSINGAIAGRVTIGAGSNAINGVTLPDDAVLYSVTFNYISGTSALTWVNSGSDGQYTSPGPAFDLLIDTPTGNYYFDGSITSPAIALSGSITGQTNVLCFGESTGSVTVTEQVEFLLII